MVAPPLPDWLGAPLLVAVGLVAGVVNTLAGGGSFLSLSAMLWLGLSPQEANATNRLGVLAQSSTAAATFGRQPDADGWWPQVLVVGAGAVLGVLASGRLDPDAYRQAMGVAMLVMVGVSVARPRAWQEPRTPHWTRWPALLLSGAYGGFLQAGVGVLLLPALVVLGGMDPVRANARKVALVAVLTVPALAIFAAWGWVDLPAGLALAAGSVAGGWLGSRLTLRGGARLVWAALVVVVAATAIALLWGPTT